LSQDYGIRWVGVDKDGIQGRRALRKIELLDRFVRALRHGDRVMAADVDLYFLGDPFTAFDTEFDVGVTTRLHKSRWPINQGVFFLRVSDKVKKFLSFYVEQCQEPSWPPLVDFRGNRIYTADWEIGQDFLCAAWLEREKIAKLYGVNIVDVGIDYNYCPDAFTVGVEEARFCLYNAYTSGGPKVLHLKSQLKMSIYDGHMKDAITKRCNGSWNWYEDKSAIQPE